VTANEPNPLILLHDKDNVLACRRRVHAGETLLIDGVPIAVSSDIDVGHKLARIDLAAGDVVLKYGAPIGSITRPTRIGEHVHTHNMKSDYMAITTRQSTGEGAKS